MRKYECEHEGHTNLSCGPSGLFLFLALFLAAAFARERFLDPLLLARFQVERVTFYFLNDVLLLYFAFKTAKSVFERLAFLQSNLCQRNYTPKLVLVELVLYCNLGVQSQANIGWRTEILLPSIPFRTL